MPNKAATKKSADKAPKFKIPKSLAACADRAYELRAERLDEQKVVDSLKKEETAIKEYLINTLPKNESSGIAGKVARATITREPVPRIADEAKLRAAIKRNPKKWGALLPKEVPIDMSVLKAMFDEGNVPPGVDTFNIVKVSLTKV